MTVQTRFILNVAFCTILFNLATTAILRSQEPSQAFDRSFRSLSRDKRNPQSIAKKTTEELPKEQPKIVGINFLDYFRKIARDNFESCFSLKELQANRPVATNLKTGKQETEQERLAAVDIDWKDLQKHCSYKYFKDQATSETHLKLQVEKGSECLIHQLFVILRENGMFSDFCFRFAVALKNYLNLLQNKGQSIPGEELYSISYKTYIFNVAKKRGDNKKLVKKEEVNELIRKTVVAIHPEKLGGDDEFRFKEQTGSGNLVNFDPTTNTFKNICQNKVKTEKLNYLLTAAHCLEDKKANEKDLTLELPKSLLEKRFVLVTMDTYFEKNLDGFQINLFINQSLKKINLGVSPSKGTIPQTRQKRELAKKDLFNDLFNPKPYVRGNNNQKKNGPEDPSLKGTIPQTEQNKKLTVNEQIDEMFKPKSNRKANNEQKIGPQDSSVNSEISIFKIDKKLEGTQFILHLFQDEDFILVKLDKEIEITCPENGQWIDFSHANENNNPRDQIVKAITDEKSVLNLYGFPGGWGPHKMKMRLFKLNDRFFKSDNPENEKQSNEYLYKNRLSKFILKGTLNNGASGGPLFLEEENKLSYIANVLGAIISGTYEPTEAKFNVRKLK